MRKVLLLLVVLAALLIASSNANKGGSSSAGANKGGIGGADVSTPVPVVPSPEPPADDGCTLPFTLPCTLE